MGTGKLTRQWRVWVVPGLVPAFCISFVSSSRAHLPYLHDMGQIYFLCGTETGDQNELFPLQVPPGSLWSDSVPLPGLEGGDACLTL